MEGADPAFADLPLAAAAALFRGSSPHPTPAGAVWKWGGAKVLTHVRDGLAVGSFGQITNICICTIHRAYVRHGFPILPPARRSLGLSLYIPTMNQSHAGRHAATMSTRSKRAHAPLPCRGPWRSFLDDAESRRRRNTRQTDGEGCSMDRDEGFRPNRASCLRRGEDRGTVIQSVLVGDGQQVTAPAESSDPAAGRQPHHVHGGRAATASTAPHTRG